MICPNEVCRHRFAYIGANIVECPNSTCRHYTERQYQEYLKETFKSGVTLTFPITTYQSTPIKLVPTIPLIYTVGKTRLLPSSAAMRLVAVVGQRRRAHFTGTEFDVISISGNLVTSLWPNGIGVDSLDWIETKSDVVVP